MNSQTYSTQRGVIKEFESLKVLKLAFALCFHKTMLLLLLLLLLVFT